MPKFLREIIYVSTVFLTACGGGSSGTKAPDTESPVFISGDTVEVFENQSNAIILKSEDESSVTYAISGEDSAIFSIESTSGIVWFKKLPDYETQETYSVVATVTDASGNESTQDITIQIKDVKSEYIHKKTGHKKSYGEDGTEILDATLKDDGFYKKGLDSNYTRKENIVTDNITNLKWYDPNDINNKQSWSGAITYCADLSIDEGHWRLPTVNELMYITDKSKSKPATHLEFVNMSPKDYWSSTEVVNAKEKALYVNFELGHDGEFDKAYLAYVRCVKGNL